MPVLDSVRDRLSTFRKGKSTSKWLNADGTPKTIDVSAKSTLSYDGIGTTKRSERVLKSYWNYYMNEGTVFASISTIAWNTIMVGYQLISDNEDVEKIMRKRLEEMDLDNILLDNVTYALVYGDAFIEKIKTKKKKSKVEYISNLKTVNPVSIQINKDKYGNETSYQQIVNGKPSKTILTKEEIIHIKFFPQADSPYGVSLIGPSKETIDRMVDVDKSLHNATVRHGTPKYVVQVGTPDEIPPKPLFDKIKRSLESITANNEFVVPGPVSINTIDESGVPNVDAYATLFQKKAIVGLMCPEESLGMSTRGSTEACNDEKTNVLTLDGWKKYWELMDDDRIATYNPKTREIEYHKSLEPVSKYIYEYDGPMIRIESNNNDMLITPNHRMYTNKSHYNSKESWDIKEASELNNDKITKFAFKSSIVPSDILYDLDMNIFEQEIIEKCGIELLMKFIGYFISEGSINKNSPYCRFSQKKLDSANRIKRVLNDFPLDFAFTYYDDKGYEFRRYDSRLWNYLREFGIDCYNRRIPRRIILQNPKYLRILLDAAIDGDGTKSSKNRYEYATTSEELADNIQEIALRCGYKSMKSFSPDNRDNRLGMFRVSILDNGNDYTTIVPKRNVTEVHYKGKIFSLNVPNHIYITRRNGKIAIQGNTAKVREIMFERFISALQHKLATKLRRELLNQLLIEEGYEKDNVYMKFNSVTTADEEGFAKWLGNFLRSGICPFSTNELRGMFKYPPIEGGDDIIGFTPKPTPEASSD